MDELILPRKYVYISYDLADSPVVDVLQTKLENSGITVSRDITSSVRTEDRRRQAREAIVNSSAVLLCLSEARLSREQSFLYEELNFIIEGFRSRPPGVPWIIPVRLDDSAVPDIELGLGATLDRMHPFKLFGSDQEQSTAELARQVRRLLDQSKASYTPRDGQYSTIEDPPDLLLRFYVPSGRLYAKEMTRLVSMFRDWLSDGRRISVRYSMNQTQGGTLHEFYADQHGDPVDLRGEFRDFTGFLELCADNPVKASDQLAQTGMGAAARADVVARYGRAMRQLNIELEYEREQMLLTVRRSLHLELLDDAVDSQLVSEQIKHLVESRIPRPSIFSPMAPLSHIPEPSGIPLTLTINQQIISAVESQIIQNVEGTVNLGPSAKEFIELINRFADHDAATLRTAVHELEDPDTRPRDRFRAGQRLKDFLWQLGSNAQRSSHISPARAI